MIGVKILQDLRQSSRTCKTQQLLLSRGGSRGRVQGVCTPPPRDDLQFSNTTGILQKKKNYVFIGVEVEQETSAPPPKDEDAYLTCYYCAVR